MKEYAFFCLLPIAQLLMACSQESDPTPQNTDGCPVGQLSGAAPFSDEV